MSERSLYERLLGEDFARLDPALQEFHRLSSARGSGQFSVVRPRGFWISLLGRLLGLPPPGAGVALRLDVEATPTGEIWRRWFGEHKVVTVQRLWRDLLIEAGGPVQLGMRVQVRHGGMTMRSIRAWLAGVPLPRWLSPSAIAVVLPAGAGWLVRVRIRLPVIGEVTRYEGKVTTHECCSESAPGARVSGSV